MDGDKADPKTFLTPYKVGGGLSVATSFRSWNFQDNATGVQPPYAAVTQQAKIAVENYDPSKNYEVRHQQ